MQHATVFTKFCSETTLKGHRIVLLCLVSIGNRMGPSKIKVYSNFTRVFKVSQRA